MSEHAGAEGTNEGGRDGGTDTGESGGPWYAMVAIVLAFTASALAYPHLPPRMAVRWNAWGEVTGWASRPLGALMGPVLMSAIWLLLRFAPRFDPRHDSEIALGTGYDVIVNAVITFLVVMHVVIMAYALGWPVPIMPVVQVSLGILTIVVGNMLPRLPPNRYAGIRTAKTLASPEAWERANRIAGRSFMIGGTIVILAAALPSPAGLIVGVSALLIATLVPVVVH